MKRFNLHLMIMLVLILAAVILAQRTDVIDIFSPKAGDVYAVGDTMKIKWVMRGERLPVGIVPLISPDDGRTWLWTIDEFIRTGDSVFYTDSIGEYDWIVTDSLRWSGPGKPNISVINEKCQININLPYDSDLGDYYSGEFTIRSSNSAIKQAFSSPRNSNNQDDWNHRGRAINNTVEAFGLDGRRISSGKIYIGTAGCQASLMIIKTSRASYTYQINTVME